MRPLELLEAEGCSVWQVVKDLQFIATEDILSSVCFCEARAGVLRILVPYQFRGLKLSSD